MTDTAVEAVSVVIPCFNQARFLECAITSARRQTHAPIEILVVDDGSTDETSTVAERLGAHVMRQPNRGLSEARNAGLAAARGDFVVMLDADDELLPGALAAGIQALRSHPSASAAVGLCQLMDESGGALPATRHAIDGADLYGEWLSKNFVWTAGAAMFRRHALCVSGGFPPRLGPAADYAVYLRLGRTEAVVAHGHEVVRYRQHEASMSRDPARMLRLTLEVLRRERRQAPARRRPQIDRGREAWCAWYGDQIVARLRNAWRSGRLGLTDLTNLLTLVRHCPVLLLRHACRAVMARLRRCGAWIGGRDSHAPPRDERLAR